VSCPRLRCDVKRAPAGCTLKYPIVAACPRCPFVDCQNGARGTRSSVVVAPGVNVGVTAGVIVGALVGGAAAIALGAFLATKAGIGAGTASAAPMTSALHNPLYDSQTADFSNPLLEA